MKKKILEFFQNIKFNFVKTLKLAFLKQKHFFGTYTDNMKEIHKFAMNEDIIPMYIADSKMQMNFADADPELSKVNPLIRVALMKEQAKEYTRNLRKEHTTTLYYVEDHIISKWIGWTPEALAYRLQPGRRRMSPQAKADMMRMRMKPGQPVNFG